MKRMLAVALGLAAWAGPATAQSPALPAPAGAPASAPAGSSFFDQLIGTWEGPYQSDTAPPGGIRLVVARENGVWQVSLAVLSDQELPASDVMDFNVAGGQVSWSQGIAGMNCHTVATIEGGFLRGGTECGDGGATVITASFLLQKK